VQPTLVELAINGDEDAYANLMVVAGDRLLAIAYRILRDVGRAEDAVQIAFVSAWRDLPTLRDPLLFEAWLTKLLVRACYGEAKRNRRWTIKPANRLNVRGRRTVGLTSIKTFLAVWI